MIRVCVVCEGQTEETFVRTVLNPSLLSSGLNLIGETIETSPGKKGGALSYPRVQKHIRNRLNQNSAPIVTTFFDLYRLDTSFPGFEISQKQNGLENRLLSLGNSFHNDIISLTQCQDTRFIPFIQPYEFEALLFSDVPSLVGIEPNWKCALNPLQKARDLVESPEHINDRPETKPAAHLERELKNPNFRKTRHGPIAAEKIGLTKIEAECKFFSKWLNTLRNLTT